MNPATIDDVRGSWPSVLTGDQERVAATLLARAWVLLRVKLPGIEGRIAGDALLSDLVAMTVTEAVARVLRNPMGYRQISESIDDYSRSNTVDSANSTGALYFTDDELELLAPVTDSGGAFSIMPGW